MIQRFTLLFILIFSFNLAFSQNTAMNNLFKKYGNQQYVTTATVSQEMFKLFTDMGDEEENKELTNFISKIDGIKILTIESDGTGDPAKSKAARNSLVNTLKSDIDKEFKVATFTELMSINDGKTNTKVLIKKKDKIITDFLMFTFEDGKAVVISIVGNIDLKSLSKVSEKMGIRGLEGINKFSE